MRINSFLAVSALALAGWSAGASANLITNGSFETGPTVNGSGFVNLGTGSTAIAGWEVTSGDIDYIGTYWNASDGNRSLDLTGTNPGAVSQAVNLGALGAGQDYKLSFDLAGNPELQSQQGAVRRLDLTITGPENFSQSFDFDVTGKSRSDIGWVNVDYLFRPAAAGLYTFTFAAASINNDRVGPALDNVRLTVIPIPPAALLFLSGLAGLALIAKRRKSANGSGPLAA